MLSASHLRKEFSSVVAVDDVSLQVQRGEICGLLGPNGAGKTTTIRMILNILHPDGGAITYDGRPFSALVRNAVGYLPEERGLYKKSRLLDTILYFAELRGMGHAVARTEALSWLRRFGLVEQKDRKVEELSKGNQQKIQFIASVIHNPELVVLDEPFSGLDPVNQLQFKDALLEMRQEGKAVIFSTHQMEQAEKLSDTLCLINKGNVVLSGTVRDVKQRFGKNSVAIEFTGDGAFMRSLHGVKVSIMYQNAAELELVDGTTPQSLLRELVGRIDIRKFEVVEPSLQSIFLGIVGATTGSSSSEEATR
jgi:ABC-2 type transport system ATP-binding protein